MTSASAGSTRTLMAVTPSPPSDIETQFYAGLAEALGRRDWRMVMMVASRHEALPGVDWIRIDNDMSRFAVRARPKARHQEYLSPEWLDPAELWRAIDWEHLRVGLAAYQPEVREGVHRLAAYADEIMTVVRPAVVLTTGVIGPRHGFFRAAGRHHGASVGIIERSPFDSLWFEPDGLFAESRVWSEWSSECGDATVGALLRSRVLGNPAGFRAAEASRSEPELGGRRRPVVLVAMDNVLWTGWSQSGNPQGALDNPAFRTPLIALQRLSAWAQQRHATLLVKPHPADRVIERLPMPGNAELIDGELLHLMRQSDAVITFNTKLAFLALAAGIRTVTLADNPAAAAGLTTHWRDFATVEETIDHALRSVPPAAPAVERFFGWLGTDYFYDSDDRNHRGPEALAARLLVDQASAGQPASDSTTEARAAVRGVLRLQVDAGPPRRRRPTDRRRVVLDVTRLADPKTRHSGITRYGRELLRYLVREPDLEVWAWFRNTGRPWSGDVGQALSETHEILHGRVIHREGDGLDRAIERSCGTLTPRDVYHSIHHALVGARALLSATRILTVHDVLHLKHPDFHDAPGEPGIARVIQSIRPRRDFVVCDSDQTRRDLMSLVPIGGSRTRVIPLGTDTLRRAVPTDQLAADFPAGYVTALMQRERRKNSEGIVEAFAHLSRDPRFRDLGVVLITSGDGQRHVTQSNMDIASHAIVSGIPRDRLVLLEGPDDERLHSVLASARAFLFGSKYEGFGLPPLEAMAAGCPVVVAANSSLIETTGSAACYAESTDASDMARAVSRVLTHPEYAAQLTAAGLERARTLSWEATARATAEFYREVVAS